MAATKAPAKADSAETELITNNSGGIRAVRAAFSTETIKQKVRGEVVEKVRPVVYTFKAGETLEIPKGDLDHVIGEDGSEGTVFSVKTVNPITNKAEAQKRKSLSKARKK